MADKGVDTTETILETLKNSNGKNVTLTQEERKEALEIMFNEAAKRYSEESFQVSAYKHGFCSKLEAAKTCAQIQTALNGMGNK